MAFFISGHLDLTEHEFNTHYVPLMDTVLKENGTFILGDAAGADKRAMEYLWGKTTNVTVYHMFDSPRHNPGFPTQGGYLSDTTRDTAMTQHSVGDIAWVRPGREKSGTAKNLVRRLAFPNSGHA
jgi:hypothetical protein